MSISQSLLPEFDHEMANTRKTLERVPDDKLGWKPHEKSMTMGRLAGHIAELPGWAAVTLEKDSFDVAPPGGETYRGMTAKSRQEALEAFDAKVAEARAVLAKATDPQMMSNWTLQAGGKTVFTMPKVAVMRSFVLNHTIHHRAQLGVYLRLNDIAVPSLYGPSADEGQMS
jgi:uncharacterized damage-inducible protein DinB